MSRRMIVLAFALASLVVPHSARATLPPFPNVTVPACITLVGSDGNVASESGAFDVVVRDLANNPMPGVRVDVDLSQVSDLRLCAQQTAPGVVVECASNRATAVTDANGVARFTLLGGGLGLETGTGMNGGRVYTDGILVASPTVNAYDLDNAGGVGANDLSYWLRDFGSGQVLGRADYDCSGGIGANDLSFWLAAFGSGTQSISCAASCP